METQQNMEIKLRISIINNLALEESFIDADVLITLESGKEEIVQFTQVMTHWEKKYSQGMIHLKIIPNGAILLVEATGIYTM